MPRRYTQTDKARVEDVSVKFAELHLFWRIAESAYMCHDFRVQLETLQTESWVLEVSLYYDTSFVQLNILFYLKATKEYFSHLIMFTCLGGSKKKKIFT